jgi:pimeloyl-ACP methyl ester carboxylesterase
VTSPVPHWPGRMVALAGGEEVWLAETPPPDNQQGGGNRGDGHLVLCVHGLSGAATNWTDFMAELVPDFRCAAVDLPGSGSSPPPKRRSGYSIRALARTVIRLTETLGAGPVHLVGNSMGGAVAIRVAATRPDLVRSLTLVSPAVPDLRVRRSVMHFPVLALPLIGERLVRAYVQRFPAENRVAGAFEVCYYDPSRVHPERFASEVERLRRRDALSYDAPSLAGAARAVVIETLLPRRFSLWGAAERVMAPSLVLFGSHDRLIHPRLAARASRAFRDARVEVLFESGHIAQMERPALVASLFREMVGEIRGPGGSGTLGNSGRRAPVDA